MKKLVALVMLVAFLTFPAATNLLAVSQEEVTWLEAGWIKISEGPVYFVTVCGGGQALNLSEWIVYAAKPYGDVPEPGVIGASAVYLWNEAPFDWTRVGDVEPFKVIVSDGSSLYALDSYGDETRYDPITHEFRGAYFPFPADAIYAGGGELFATAEETGDIYHWSEKPFDWTKIGSSKGMLAADDAGHLYGLTPGGSIWRYTGEPMKWEKIGEPFGKIYASGNELFATSLYYTEDIYHWNGKPFDWTKIGGSGWKLAVADDGHLYRLSHDGSVWEWLGVPLKWKKIGGPASEIYAGGTGKGERLLAIDRTTGDLWLYQP